MSISDINFSTTRIQAFKNGQPIGTATGFFFKHGDAEFLITNRHVVINEQEDYFPDALSILMHADKDNLTKNNEASLLLYDKNKSHFWLEHPLYQINNCDVVAIPLTPQTLSGGNYAIFLATKIRNFSQEQAEIPELLPFGDVVVVGYPRGFYDDKHNLPVYRKAMMASQYGIDFRGKPYFLVDANLHPGTSGSPVVNSHHTLFKTGGPQEGYKLFGVHSAQHVVNGDPLGLNVVWYSYLITEVIEQVTT
jgi:V8-like Glu-specific endopeptidase